MVNEVRALGFEYAELGHGTRLSLLDGVLQAVAAGEIKICSLHNFCPLPLGVMGAAPDYYLPSSRDEDERQCAVRHTLRTLDCAVGVTRRLPPRPAGFGKICPSMSHMWSLAPYCVSSGTETITGRRGCHSGSR